MNQSSEGNNQNSTLWRLEIKKTRKYDIYIHNDMTKAVYDAYENKRKIGGGRN